MNRHVLYVGREIRYACVENVVLKTRKTQMYAELPDYWRNCSNGKNL